MTGSGGTKGMTGGSAGTALGTGGTATVSVDAGVSGKSIQCVSEVKPGLPKGAPALTAGTWTDIKPSGITWGENGHAIEFACDPATRRSCTPASEASILHGPFSQRRRRSNVVTHWQDRTRRGERGGSPGDGGAMIRLNPQDPHKVLLRGGCARGNRFLSISDAGDTVQIPKGFRDVGTQASLYQWDVYDIDVDPADFKHVLLSFH